MGKSFKDGGKKSHRDGSKYAKKKERQQEEVQHAPRSHFSDEHRPTPTPRPTPPRIPTLPNPVLPGAPGAPAKGEKQGTTKLIHSDSFRGDGKIFYVDAVENERGKALRIAEVSKGKRTIIMIPACLLANFETAQGKVTPFLA